MSSMISLLIKEKKKHSLSKFCISPLSLLLSSSNINVYSVLNSKLLFTNTTEIFPFSIFGI